jgi:hypothetical protein
VIGGAVAGIAVGQGDVSLPLIGLVKPWQLAFLLVGLAGLLPLLLIVTTVREPQRKGAMADRAPKFAEVAAHYRRHRRAIGLHHLAFTALTFSSYGVGSWLPSFFVRTYGWPIGQTGLWLGINAAVTASVSVMIGGWLADRWYRQGKKDAKMRVPLLGSLLWLAPGFSYLLAPTGTISMVLLTIATLIGHLGIGCIVASLQELMPNRLRGQAVAIYAVVANLIGLGLGPTAVALLTDYVFGDESQLRYSLLVVAVVCHAVMSIALWLSLEPYRESVTELERAAAVPATS